MKVMFFSGKETPPFSREMSHLPDPGTVIRLYLKEGEGMAKREGMHIYQVGVVSYFEFPSDPGIVHPGITLRPFQWDPEYQKDLAQHFINIQD